MRPPMWLWLVVIGVGSGVALAEMRRQEDVAALELRLARAEAAVKDRCFLTRTPRAVAEVGK